jgi:restriction system protein
MPIPTYDQIMLPLLRFLEDGKEASTRQAADAVADKFGLTQKERDELLPSGNQTYILNRTGWAAFHLIKAGLLSKPKRAHLVITDSGKQALKNNPVKIDRDYLMKIPAFSEFMASLGKRAEVFPFFRSTR